MGNSQLACQICGTKIASIRRRWCDGCSAERLLWKSFIPEDAEFAIASLVRFDVSFFFRLILVPIIILVVFVVVGFLSGGVEIPRPWNGLLGFFLLMFGYRIALIRCNPLMEQRVRSFYKAIVVSWLTLTVLAFCALGDGEAESMVSA